MVPINAAAIKIFFIQGEFLVFTQYMCHKSIRITMFAYFYNMSVIKSVIILSFGLLPFSAGAWGVLGHRIIGEIASHYLSPKAKKEVKKILGDETLAMASNWGDFIKSDSTYKYLNSWHYINLPPKLTRRQFDDQLGSLRHKSVFKNTGIGCRVKGTRNPSCQESVLSETDHSFHGRPSSANARSTR